MKSGQYFSVCSLFCCPQVAKHVEAALKEPLPVAFSPGRFGRCLCFRCSERWEEWTVRKDEAASTWPGPNLPTCRSWRGGSGRSCPPKSSPPPPSECRTEHRTVTGVWQRKVGLENKLFPLHERVDKKFQKCLDGRLKSCNFGKWSYWWYKVAIESFSCD